MELLRRVGIVAVSMLAHIGFAQDAPKPWTITLEQAWISQPGFEGATQRYSWAVLNYRLSDRWEAVGGFYSNPRNGSLDENYLAYDNGIRLRVGRMNPNFGFGNWSDLYYTPFNSMAQFRSYSYGAHFGLFRYVSGAEAQFTGSKVQATVGAFDTDLNDQQLEPHKVDHVFARVQTSIDSLILGLNASLRTGKHEGVTQKNWYLLDARWTMPRLQFYSEAFYGEGQGMTTRGVVGSVVYRPPHLTRTQLAFRADQFNSTTEYATVDRLLCTAAVRQILSPALVASLNYAWGDPNDIVYTKRGWSLQLMATVRF